MPRAIARIKATKPEAELPPIPSAVYSMLGPVPIVMVADLKHTDGTELLGKWCPEERCIKIRAGIALVTQHVTLVHEMIHVAAWDAGCGLDEATEERVADGLSSYLFAAGFRA